MEMNEGNDDPNNLGNEPTYTDEPETGLNINFGKKTENTLMNRFLNKALEKGLQDPRPSKLDQLYASITDKIAENSIQSLLTNLGGGAPQHKGRVEDFVFGLLNTQAAASFGAGLGSRIPETIESLTKSLGKNKAEEIANVIMSKMSCQNQNSQPQQPLTPEEQQKEKQRDIILQLDENNPEHLKAYAENMGLSMDVASGFLKAQKLDILAQREKRQTLQLSPPQQDMQKINDEIQKMQDIIKKQNEVIQQLQGKKAIADEEQAEQEYEKSISPDARWNEGTEIPRNPTLQPQSANLFSQKVVVDVDKISEAANLKESFFENPQPKEPEIPQLIEEKDEHGNSSFKMSGDQPIEITTQPVKPITPKEETPKEEVKEEVEDEPEIDEGKVKDEPITRHEVVKEEITEVSMPEIKPIKEETKTEDVKEDKKEEVKTESVKEDRKKPIIRKVKK